jgi:beta-glucosidase
VGYTHHDEGEYVDPSGVAHLFHLFPPMTDPRLGEQLQATLQSIRSDKRMSPGGDRRSLTLRESEEVLIEAVSAANPRTIVAVMGGSAVLMERWRERVAAILLIWYPGMEGGHALADVLLGHVDPGGRLPFAVPTDPSHLPHFDRDATTEEYDLWHGQWKLDRDGNAPAYPFGFGLSYTAFRLSDLSVAAKGDEHVVNISIANTGGRPGRDVVQVYGGMAASSHERPLRKLLAFRRIDLAAGESRRIELTFNLQPLAIRRKGDWWMEPGTYQVSVARYAGDPLALHAQIEAQ